LKAVNQYNLLMWTDEGGNTVKMISFFKCCYLIIVIFIAGDVVSSLCFKNKFKSSLPLRFSIAYGLGTGTWGLSMFYLSYLGGSINFRNIFFSSLVFMACFIYYSAKGLRSCIPNTKFPHRNFKKGILYYFFLALIIVSLSILIFRSLYLPMHLADDRAQWGIKAKILYHDGTIYSHDFFDPLRVMYHASYPLLVPLIESLFYSALEEMNDCVVKLPFPLFFLSLLLFFYASQKRFSNTRHALMFTSMVAVLPIFTSDIHGNPSSGYADVPLTLYYTISTISLSNWMKDRKIEDLLMATICILFSIFTKREGLILWVIATMAILFSLFLFDGKEIRNKLLFGGIFIVLPLIVLIPWFHFSSTFNPGPWERDFEISYLTYKHIHSHLYRIPFIMKSFIKTIFALHYFNIIWLIFFITMAFSIKDIFCFPQAFLLLLLVLNISALLVAIFIYPWPWWHNFLHDMPRLLMVNIPLMMYTISCQFHRGKFLKPYF